MLSSQLDAAESSASSDWERFHVANCRLEVTAMHFFKSPETLDVLTCQLIFDTSIKVSEFIQDQERSRRLSSCCPRFIVFAATLGQALMLRIIKGPFADCVDHERGYALMQIIVSFMRSAAIEQGDKASKVAMIVEQIRSANNIFKDVDGSFNIALRVKTRLSASVIHDAGIRWREKFLDSGELHDSQQSASTYPTSKGKSKNNSGTNHLMQASVSPNPVSHPSPITPNMRQDDSIATLDAEMSLVPTDGLLGDLGFDLDDLWIPTFE
ncbi:MAG: hypothetical protein M1821_001043 [Bathelium mastoideum]|nr:MAG: hypothetical protein M1821_001043 [Bathelium mastoideum]KAI9693932.1 MAG: hypothetical protein M1822_003203 [Bathelium mastoideum]